MLTLLCAALGGHQRLPDVAASPNQVLTHAARAARAKGPGQGKLARQRDLAYHFLAYHFLAYHGCLQFLAAKQSHAQ